MAERTATSRLARLLALVPYVLSHQGVGIKAAAKEFAISEAQLRDDLDLIFVSGLPGYSHLELIDVVMEHDSIHIHNADVIAKPMRLHPDEALSLMIGLELLAPIASDDVATLKTKLSEAALVPLDDLSERFAVVDQDSAVGSLIHDALVRERRLLLDYYVPSRDEVTTREVDPLRIEVIDAKTYLAAYCRQAEGIRYFRLDRIVDAKIVDRPSSPPADLSLEPIFAHSSDVTVEIEADESARWLIDHLGATVIQESPLRISAPLVDRDFFRRLALSLADQIEILSPQALRDEISASAKAALNNS